MNNGTRRALTGSIHKIREFELEKVCLVEEFDILQIVGEGWFGKILLVEHRASDTEIVLKALPKPYVSIRDFYREFHYGLHLSAHKNIVTTFDVAFETAGFYVFCQEYAPLGDLTSNMLDTGIGEIHTKRVAKQLAAALEHLHQRDLVHRDVKLDNILIFKSDFSRIKLCDFGETRKVQAVVRRRNEWLPYSPPEVLKLSMDSSYKALISHDIWQFGIVIFICLTGCLPWQKAAFDDPRYVSYLNWYSSANPLKKQPKLWKMVSSRAQKMFKKFIEPKEEKRATNFAELSRYLDDRWMAKGYTDRVAGGDIDELCPSMYSFHSDPNEKNILLRHFRDSGVEVIVDRQAKKQRIREWIQNSVIEEADEEEESNYDPSIMEESDGELEDRSRPHPIDESHRVTLRFDTEKHINPRTGEVIEGVKHTEKNPLSYDVQNIEPVAPSNVARRYGVKEDASMHSSTKDSAYGSLDVHSQQKSTSNRPDAKHVSIERASNVSPSRSLAGSSIHQTVTPLSSHVQRFQRTEEVFTKELENQRGSTSTLHSMGNSSRSNSLRVTRNSSLDSASNVTNDSPLENDISGATSRPNNPVITQNGFSPGSKQNSSITQPYVSMKNTVYETVTTRTDPNQNKEETNLKNSPDSPYTSMMNIVQGQIKISPLANETDKNIVNVSVTSVNRKKVQ
ncbi:serine/threonine-protein kinase meng-po [Papilio machaon]|uniref:serine/threonine-protein kinase meng-po n=1 Tax=Papilio machaon TaxID=76193 RepID=UPI001E665B9C|nr:serine/threonine-protein kinase meng-po [Papilio machaon]XP_014362218.2 serine/threonine-protein kinase meng-po [Papilio machaon]XP_045536116.1 serine/threonine-protein kinase meng-po [Papilio machaon]